MPGSPRSTPCGAFQAALDELPPEEVAAQRRLLDAVGGQKRNSFAFGIDVILTGLETLPG